MNNWASRVSTGPQFIYTGFWRMSRNQNRGSERGTNGRHTKHRLFANELLDFQSKAQDHNLYILDFGMGHIGADTEAHQFWKRNYWASKSNHRTTI